METRKTLTTCYLDIEDLAKLNEKAKKEGRKVSAVIRETVKQGLNVGDYFETLNKIDLLITASSRKDYYEDHLTKLLHQLQNEAAKQSDWQNI